MNKLVILANNINLSGTLLSGQAFRIKECDDGSFTIILSDRVVNIKKELNNLIIKSNNYDNLESIILDYLDLNRNYEEINNKILKNHKELKNVIDYSKGYKILCQPKFEMLISYIISQNNSVRNISSSIEKISRKFGKKVIFNNEEYYLFPTFDELKDVSILELNECKVGFRANYIINALNVLKNDSDYLEKLEYLSGNDAMMELMKIKGIGMKVASCILLFGYSKFNTFPIDTWVKKFFNEEKADIIRKKAYEQYGEYSGLVIQYMFHYSRNKNVL